MKRYEEMINMIAEAYISIYGTERWISLTDKEKHDAVMIIAKDLDNMTK